MAYTGDDAASLGRKLAELDLTDGESAALFELLWRATSDGDEVIGFVDGEPRRVVSGPIPLPVAVPRALGFIVPGEAENLG